MSAKVQAILRALAGEKAPTGKSRTGYAHPYQHYANLYGKDLSTIKRWAREGRPLDDEATMREILSPRGRKPDFPTGAETNFPEDEGESSSPVSLEETFFAGSGVLAAITRLQKAERERAAAYFQAVKTRQHSKVVQERFKEWMGLISALQKLEEAAPGIRKANDLTVDVAEMDLAIGTVFAAFRTAVRSMPGRAAAKLIGLRDRDEIFAILEKEMEVLLRTLTDIAVGKVRESELLAQPIDEAPAEAAATDAPTTEEVPIETESVEAAPKIEKRKRKARRRK